MLRVLKVVMRKFQFRLTIKSVMWLASIVYLLPNWVIEALIPNIRIFGPNYSTSTRRTRVRTSGYSPNPNPGSEGSIFVLPFTGPDGSPSCDHHRKIFSSSTKTLGLETNKWSTERPYLISHIRSDNSKSWRGWWQSGLARQWQRQWIRGIRW